MDVVAKFLMRVEKRANNQCWLYKGKPNPQGYGTFYDKSLDGERLTHRVSYRLFKGAIPEGLQVRHLCHQRMCVNPEHLVLGTRQMNADDMTRAGRQAKRSMVANAIFTEATAKEAIERYARNERVVDIAAAYGVSPGTVNKLVRGITWADLKRPKGLTERSLSESRVARGSSRGTNNPRALLDEPTVARVKADLRVNKQHGGVALVAKKYGVAYPTISAIAQGRTWGWVK